MADMVGARRMLVAGGAGFVGRAVARAARDAGFEVEVTWRSTPPPEGFPAHQLSIDDLDAAAEMVARVCPDVVAVSLGGRHRPASAEERLAVWRDAPVATSALLEACRAGRPHVILLASSHELAPSLEPHSESSPVGPTSWRGIAGHAATQAARQWERETGAPMTIMRPFSVYGSHEPQDRVIPTLLHAAVSGSAFHATDTGSRRDFVFVDDVADAVVLAAAQTRTGEFNLGTGVGVSVSELVDLVELASGTRIDVTYGSFEPRSWDRPMWVADPSHAASELGWRAETPLLDGLRSLLP